MLKLKKIYPLNQSPLFKITSKKRLLKLLEVDILALSQLAYGDSYRDYVSDEGRPIQYPIGDLAIIHKKLAIFLSSIETPDYLTSKKGSSYIKNAGRHLGDIPLIKTDIAKFYPSIGFGYILRMFIDEFKCSTDVSWILAKLCSFKGQHLPTGSKISGYIAYFANRKMFDDLNQLAVENNCTMTCYVDDIIISGALANKTLLTKVRRVILRNGLITKDKKSKCYSAFATKKLTGCIVRGEKMYLPNIRHHKIALLRRELLVENDPIAYKRLESTLKGRLVEAKQITG